MSTQIEITDIDEIIKNEKPRIIKACGYEVDLNKMSLKTHLAIKEVFRNDSLRTEAYILERVIYPLIAEQNKGVSFNDAFKKNFYVKKILLFWKEINIFMISPYEDSEASLADTSENESKKKEE